MTCDCERISATPSVITRVISADRLASSNRPFGHIIATDRCAVRRHAPPSTTACAPNSTPITTWTARPTSKRIQERQRPCRTSPARLQTTAWPEMRSWRSMDRISSECTSPLSSSSSWARNATFYFELLNYVALYGRICLFEKSEVEGGLLRAHCIPIPRPCTLYSIISVYDIVVVHDLLFTLLYRCSLSIIFSHSERASAGALSIMLCFR